MAVNAKRLIRDGKVVLDERDDWSEHAQPLRGAVAESRTAGAQ